MRHLGLVEVLAIPMSACVDVTDETHADIVPSKTVVEALWSQFVGCQSIEVRSAP